MMPLTIEDISYGIQLFYRSHHYVGTRSVGRYSGCQVKWAKETSALSITATSIPHSASLVHNVSRSFTTPSFHPGLLLNFSPLHSILKLLAAIKISNATNRMADGRGMSWQHSPALQILTSYPSGSSAQATSRQTGDRRVGGR